MNLKKSELFKLAFEPTEPIEGSIATKTSTITAAAVTKAGLRGKAMGLDKNVPEQKKQISKIKDEADGLGKEIYKKVIKEAGVVLRVRVSEGFGRDEVADSFKSSDIVNPDGKAGMEDAIIDVIEGTNPFVTNFNNRSVEELKSSDVGGTSTIVIGDGVESLGNCPDYYADSIFTTVPEEKRREFIDDPLDTEITMADPSRLEEVLERIARANAIAVSDMEVMIMERKREAERFAALKDVQKRHPGMEIVTIKDGTLAHSLVATFGRKQGKHMVTLTMGGAPEAFTNLAIAGLFKEYGALGTMRIASKETNKTAGGGDARDFKRRYDFNEDEKKEIRELRPGDADEIFEGNKVFTQEDVKGDVEGSFAFITNDGVFKIRGVEKMDDSFKVNVLRVKRIEGKPCAWFEQKIFDSADLEKYI